jgi:hypothetical protein
MIACRLDPHHFTRTCHQHVAGFVFLRDLAQG